MPDVTSVWVAVPNGLTAGAATERRLRLSVAVSLRLGSDLAPGDDDPPPVPLETFADASGWAKTVAGLSFAVELPDGTTLPSNAVTVVSRPDPDLWTALFDDAAPVRPHRLDPVVKRTVFNTYSARGVGDQVTAA